jgi:serine/threonine protein kinase
MDFLQLADDVQVARLLAPATGRGDDERVLFSAEVQKYNRRNVKQPRLLVVTNLAFYNLDRSKRLRRRIDLTFIEGVVVSTVSEEFVIHVPSEYDYRLASPRRDAAVSCIVHARFSALGFGVPMLHVERLAQAELKHVTKLRTDAETRRVAGGGAYSCREEVFADMRGSGANPWGDDASNDGEAEEEALPGFPPLPALGVAGLVHPSPRAPLLASLGTARVEGDGGEGGSASAARTSPPGAALLPACASVGSYSRGHFAPEWRPVHAITSAGTLGSGGFGSARAGAFAAGNAFGTTPASCGGLSLGPGGGGAVVTGHGTAAHAPPPSFSLTPAPGVLSKAPISLDDFELLRVVGRGSYGKVLAVRAKRSGEVLALKVLAKSRVIARAQVEHTQAERAILETIDHPFLVSLRAAFQTPTKLYLVLPFLRGGEVFTHLKAWKQFDEDLARFYVAEVTLGVGHLHELGIVYRDLKPENVLLDEFGHVRLTDFGLSKVLLGPTDAAHTFCGTPEYLAPEVIDGSPHDRGVDWWALGVLLWEMLTGLPPFYHVNVQAMYNRILIADLVWPMDAGGGHLLSPSARSLLTGLLERDPLKRLGCMPPELAGGQGDVEQVKAHPFFASVDWAALFARRVPPPWRPPVVGSADVSNFDGDFTSQAVQDSASSMAEVGRGLVGMEGCGSGPCGVAGAGGGWGGERGASAASPASPTRGPPGGRGGGRGVEGGGCSPAQAVHPKFEGFTFVDRAL